MCGRDESCNRPKDRILPYRVATISRLLEIIGLFCRISFFLQGSFAKETYHLKEPTNPCHPITVRVGVCMYVVSPSKDGNNWCISSSEMIFPGIVYTTKHKNIHLISRGHARVAQIAAGKPEKWLLKRRFFFWIFCNPLANTQKVYTHKWYLHSAMCVIHALHHVCHSCATWLTCMCVTHLHVWRDSFKSHAELIPL